MTEMTLRPLAALAAELLETLQPLLDHPLGAVPGEAIARAHALAQALHQGLSPRPEPAIDRATFDALLEIAGETTTPKLLLQVLVDLGNVRAALGNALPPRTDWPTLRQQSHILMSIAGSFGANSLYRDAEALNRIAHAGDAAALADLQAPLQEKLAALLQFLTEETERRGHRAERQGSAL